MSELKLIDAMEEYISREVLIEEIEEEIEAENSFKDGEKLITKGLKIALKDIKKQKSADVEPVRHGRWIRGVSKGFPKNPTCLWYCSCCGEKIRYVDTLRTYQKIKKPVNEVNPRCRRCGAKMDGGKK